MIAAAFWLSLFVGYAAATAQASSLLKRPTTPRGHRP
jgi:hypothetical protein